MLVRRAIERLARNRVLKRHLPNEFGGGPLFVSPDAALSLIKPGTDAFDLPLLRAIREFVGSGDCFWDIGANVGLATFAAAHAVGVQGKVVAVEADLWLAQLLRRSAALPENAAYPIDIIPGAVSDRIGTATFLIAARGRASNCLEVAGGRSQAGGVRERNTVITVTLDALIDSQPRPKLVKIDVEGAEALVLAGAKRLLGEIRPHIIIETGKSTLDTCTSLFREARYELYDVAMPVLKRTPLLTCSFNTLAIPIS